ncbi:MAG: PfkB family carbohydrate kinase [Pseudomonadota bacterium]
MRKDGVDLNHCLELPGEATGVALIAVSADGENQIIVAPGANDRLQPSDVPDIKTDATLSVLEVPVETVLRAAQNTSGIFAANLAPALPVPDELIALSDLIIVNEGEADTYGDQLHHCKGMVAVTYGARGAALFKNGKKIAAATPPRITVADTTGAGDTFSAALVVALCRGMKEAHALDYACAAGALTATRPGAQPSFPTSHDMTLLSL